MKKKILGVIPARFQSSRFPGKPLARILGKTLLQRTYESALQCTMLDKLVVATDDKRIYDHVHQFHGEAVMTSADCLTGSDRIAEAVRLHPRFDDYECIIGIQGDEPCIEPEVIAGVIEALNEKDSPLMSSAVMPLESAEEALNPSVVKCVFDSNRNALYFSRALIPAGKTADFKSDVSYYKHIGIYGYRRDFLLKYATMEATALQMAEDLEQLKVLENGIAIRLAIVKSSSIGVDTPEDIKKVETLLCKQNSFL
jgi:3-deoxy-manno-octulosonate cytidylyltransferase (CMP-KDO synthetase)